MDNYITHLTTLGQMWGYSFEQMMDKVNRISDGGYNDLSPYGVDATGSSKQERIESIKRSLEKKFA